MADDATTTPEPNASVSTPTAAAADATSPPVADPTPSTQDEVNTKLAEFGVTDADVVSAIRALGVATVEDLAVLNEADFVTAGVPVVQARKLVQAVTPATTTSDVAFGSNTFAGVLPAVPEFDSLLGMLKAGGVLKVEASTVIAAMQASIAYRAGLFAVPDKLAAAILQYATDNEEPVDQSYWPLKQQLTRRNYGDLFAAIEGFDGRNVSERAKQGLFAGVDKYLWPGLVEFASVLDGWMDAWTKGSSNPAAMMAAFQAMASGHGGVGPAVGVAPDTGGLRDQADKFNDGANRAFAGEGVQIAAAVAYDAKRIRDALSNPRLPSLVGAANYEQMLRQLGVQVSAADSRLETNIVQYVMALMQVKNVPGGNDELSYFNALYMLGSQIPWDQFGGGGYTGVAGRVRDL